jgi:hypothetical protein
MGLQSRKVLQAAIPAKTFFFYKKALYNGTNDTFKEVFISQD